MGFGAPTVQGRQGIAVQEAYDLLVKIFTIRIGDTKLKVMEHKRKEMQEIEITISPT